MYDRDLLSLIANKKIESYIMGKCGSRDSLVSQTGARYPVS